MLTAIVKKQAAINRFKFTLTALGILVINIFLVFNFPTRAESTDNFLLNLKVCVKDENNNPIKNSNVSLRIFGGNVLSEIPYDPKTGCGLVDVTRQFTASKQYVILVSTQGEKGVKIAARHFDPSSYKVNPSKVNSSEPNKTSAGIIKIPVIEISVKDGVSVFNKEGNSLYYNDLVTNVSVGSVPPESANVSSGINNPGNSNTAVNTNMNSGNGGGKNQDGSLSWRDVISIFNLLVLLILLGIYVRPLVQSFFQEDIPESDDADLPPAGDEVRTDIIKDVNSNAQTAVLDALEEIKALLTAKNAKTEPETVASDNKAYFAAEIPPESEIPAEIPDFSSIVTTSSGQMEDAQRRYKALINGSVTDYLELHPTGDSSPEHMVGHQAAKLCEYKSGKYVAFPLETKLNEAWIFPARGYKFSENFFSPIFPELTKEEYESGNITPKNAVKKDGMWLIVSSGEF